EPLPLRLGAYLAAAVAGGVAVVCLRGGLLTPRAVVELRADADGAAHLEVLADGRPSAARVRLGPRADLGQVRIDAGRTWDASRGAGGGRRAPGHRRRRAEDLGPPRHRGGRVRGSPGH